MSHVTHLNLLDFLILSVPLTQGKKVLLDLSKPVQIWQWAHR